MIHASVAEFDELRIDKLGENLAIHGYIVSPEIGAVRTGEVVPTKATEIALTAGWLQL